MHFIKLNDFTSECYIPCIGAGLITFGNSSGLHWRGALLPSNAHKPPISGAGHPPPPQPGGMDMSRRYRSTPCPRHHRGLGLSDKKNLDLEPIDRQNGERYTPFECRTHFLFCLVLLNVPLVSYFFSDRFALPSLCCCTLIVLSSDA